MRSRRKALITPLACCLVLALAACTPGTQSSTRRTTVEELSGTSGFYPAQAGARWEYLPQGAPVDLERSIVVVEGPRVVGNDVLTGWRFFGGGLDHRYYRSYSSDGVRLHVQTYPGAQLTFNPPILEYPGAAQLARGARWSGTSQVEIHQPAAPPEMRLVTAEIRYEYFVVDRRRVRVTAGDFDVYVINRVTRQYDAEGRLQEELTQEIWFSPYTGEIRNIAGEFLVGLNFTPVLPE